MNYAQIIFELNHDELRDHPDFTDEDLKEVLKILVKKKQIILIIVYHLHSNHLKVLAQ